MAEQSPRVMPERTWAEDRYPTPEEWTAWYEAASTEERLEIAERVMDLTSRGAHCVELDHQRRICHIGTDLDKALRQVERVRALADWADAQVVTHGHHDGSAAEAVALLTQRLRAALDQPAAAPTTPRGDA